MSGILGSLRVRQVEARVRPWRDRLTDTPPPGGWTKAIRQALGMSSRQLAQRLGITRQAVIDLERREKDGRITVGALTKAARAMGCELVYAIVPKNNLEEMIRNRARNVAARRLRRVSHSMALEAQSTSAEEEDRLLDELVADLLKHPRSLWEEGEPR